MEVDNRIVVLSIVVFIVMITVKERVVHTRCPHPKKMDIDSFYDTRWYGNVNVWKESSFWGGYDVVEDPGCNILVIGDEESMYFATTWASLIAGHTSVKDLGVTKKLMTKMYDIFDTSISFEFGRDVNEIADRIRAGTSEFCHVIISVSSCISIMNNTDGEVDTAVSLILELIDSRFWYRLDRLNCKDVYSKETILSYKLFEKWPVLKRLDMIKLLGNVDYDTESDKAGVRIAMVQSYLKFVKKLYHIHESNIIDDFTFQNTYFKYYG